MTTSPCALAKESSRTIPFDGVELRAIELSHRDILSPFLEANPHSLSGYTFATLHAWRKTFDYGWTCLGEKTLLLTWARRCDPRRHLLQPIGPLSPGEGNRILEIARQLDYSLTMAGVEQSFLESFPWFVDHFEVHEEPENANYLYRTSDLARLAGRAFSKKRNLIAQAEREYLHTVEALTPANIADARSVLAAVKAEDQTPIEPSLQQEIAALEETLGAFGDLRQSGVLLRVNGQPAAFAIFEQQTPETAVIHFERALRRYKGLYQLVNRAAARAIEELGFRWINREEDLGNPGLKQAKQSYNPIGMAPAFRLVWKGSGA